MARVQLFISTVSAEFLSYRDRLRQSLTRPNVEVKVQEDFIVTGNETLEMLDEYIKGCDGVIHLVGDMTGSLAKAPSLTAIKQCYPDLATRLPLAEFLQPDGPSLAYTQWEAWLALLHMKKLFIATPTPEAARDAGYLQDPAQQALQQAHLKRLRAVSRYPGVAFTGQEHLEAKVLGSFVLDLLVEAGLSERPQGKTKRALEIELFATDFREEKALNGDKVLAEMTNENYIALDHGIPYYRDRNILAKASGSRLIVGVPYEFHSKLNEDGHVFDIRDETLSYWTDKINASFQYFKIENPEETIRQAAIEEATVFCDDIHNGYHRFNSELFGVERIRPNRVGENEEASLKLDFYSTDYFTHRVFGNIYRKWRKSSKINANLRIPEINKYFTPFLSSFGIGCFIILDRGKGDEILLAHRSNSVMVDKGKIHYSMNEAFSLNDTESVDRFPSVKECLLRGLREELGLSSRFAHNISDLGFLDLGIITDRCEVGISAFVRIKWDDEFQFNHLGELYSIGQDAELETDGLELVRVSALDKYISSSYTSFSEGCRSTLRLLLARYKAGYL